MYTQVILFKKAGEFDSPLTYAVPNELKTELKPGVFVQVPLRGRQVRGVVTSIESELPSDLDAEKIKPIQKVIPNLTLTENQIELGKAIAVYYQTSLTRSLRLMMPAAIWKGKFELPINTFYKISNSEIPVRGEKQKQVIDALSERMEEARPDGSVGRGRLREETGATLTTLRSLITKGVIESEEEAIYEKPDYAKFPLKPHRWQLTSEQEKAVERVEKGEKPILLHGVTGSGKTEIYLRVILEAVQKGKQAILLVPEIALTPQMIEYFKDSFGDHIAVFHSKLSDGERAREWWKVRCGYAPLVIGSRSAVFAPAQDLGVVILDEEHEWTYKQESSPYYSTHHVGEMLSSLWNSKLVFGTATPRMETLYKAKEGEYEHCYLPERINEKELPKIQVVDLRDEFKARNFSVLSNALQQSIKARLEAKEQIILFINQRGLASAVVCRDCGYTTECPHCEVSLKLHRYGKEELVCHYCGFVQAPPLTCPECQSAHIRHVGVGTQRVEDEVKKLFPNARTIRADKDTTSHKEGFAPIYRDFKDRKYDVLIGTQMVAKGLDFENVTLIGIILADIGMHMPDFRSHERLFQLITQVAGRCGRGKAAGNVILQTYQPNHFTIQKSSTYDYDAFMEEELSYRKKLSYPPYNRMIKFTVVGFDQEKLRDHIQQEVEVLEDIFKVNKLPFKIISAPAMIAKMGGRYYYHVLLRAADPQVIFKHWKTPKGWRIDVDPIHTV